MVAGEEGEQTRWSNMSREKGAVKGVKGLREERQRAQKKLQKERKFNKTAREVCKWQRKLETITEIEKIFLKNGRTTRISQEIFQLISQQMKKVVGESLFENRGEGGLACLQKVRIYFKCVEEIWKNHPNKQLSSSIHHYGHENQIRLIGLHTIK